MFNRGITSSLITYGWEPAHEPAYVEYVRQSMGVAQEVVYMKHLDMQ